MTNTEDKKDSFQHLPPAIIREVDGVRYVCLADVPITQAMIDACKRDVEKYRHAAIKRKRVAKRKPRRKRARVKRLIWDR